MTAELRRKRPTAVRRMLRLLDTESVAGYVFIAPWLVGFLAFALIPFVSSLGLSFMDWQPRQPSSFIGFKNYEIVFTADPLFYKSLVNTAYYVGVHVPLNIGLGLVSALLLNERIRGQAIFRTIYYIPAVTSGVATALLWVWMFNRDFGVVNQILGAFGIPAVSWLGSTAWAMPSMILIGTWAFGTSMVIVLAGLQAVPEHLYEAAAVDGANAWRRFRHVTIPLLSPTLFFLTVVGIIGSFQVFTTAFIVTQGGPGFATLFYVLHLYYKSFQDLNFGYGSALAWILFLIIMVLTLIQMWAGRRWVYYEGEAAS